MGSDEIVVSDLHCYDISGTKSGHLLLAREGGIDVLDAKSKEFLRTLEFQLYVFTIDVYKDIVIIGVRLSESEKEIVVLSEEYDVLRRWPIPESTQDFTAVDDKIFLSIADESTSNINVFSINGERLLHADVIWNGRVAGITSVLPCSLIYDDRTEHKVYKQCVTTGRRRKEWAAPVTAPHCLCVDANGLIWVRSNANDSLTILNRDGKCRQTVAYCP